MNNIAKISEVQPHNNNSNNVSNINSNTEIVKTYSNIFLETTETNDCLILNQAIVFMAVDGIKQIDYFIQKLVNLQQTQIISTSRICKKHFCICLYNQNIANELVKNNQKIQVNNKEITKTKLINPSKRLILSNVYLITQ